MIQTYDPQHEVIRHVLTSDYRAMYRAILSHRQEFHYPPFCRMVRIVLRHKTPQTLDAGGGRAGGARRAGPAAR